MEYPAGYPMLVHLRPKRCPKLGHPCKQVCESHHQLLLHGRRREHPAAPLGPEGGGTTRQRRCAASDDVIAGAVSVDRRCVFFGCFGFVFIERCWNDGLVGSVFGSCWSENVLACSGSPSKRTGQRTPLIDTRIIFAWHERCPL